MDKKKEVKLEALNKIYREMAELVGVSNAVKIYKSYKGLQVNFPTRLYYRGYVIEEAIKAEEKGISLRKLAVEYNYSERWLKEMLVENKKKNEEDKKK